MGGRVGFCGASAGNESCPGAALNIPAHMDAPMKGPPTAQSAPSGNRERIGNAQGNRASSYLPDIRHYRIDPDLNKTVYANRLPHFYGAEPICS